MISKKQDFKFKKSLLSIVMISTVTSGLIAVEKHQGFFQLPEINSVNEINQQGSELIKNINALALIAQTKSEFSKQAKIAAELLILEEKIIELDEHLNHSQIAALSKQLNFAENITKNSTIIDF